MPKRYLSNLRDIGVMILLGVIVADIIMKSAGWEGRTPLEIPSLLIIWTIILIPTTILHLKLQRLDKRK